jgi:glucose-1-phosphate cytidylyltransferase
MKAVILAGGLGSRLSEETSVKPKPMVEIGDQPILWHIMKIYSFFGINDFIICLGYKGYVIKEYFANYALHTSDITFDFRTERTEIHECTSEPWRVTLVDTGLQSMTGGRIHRIAKYVGDETFLMTYGDAVANVNIAESVAFHRAHGREATVTAVRPPSRFGRLSINDQQLVQSFDEKPRWDGGWINGGFFVLEPSILSRIADDATIWERAPMESLARDRQLGAFQHNGFWQPMDTLRDKLQLQDLWEHGIAPWKVWEGAPFEFQHRKDVEFQAFDFAGSTSESCRRTKHSTTAA